MMRLKLVLICLCCISPAFMLDAQQPVRTEKPGVLKNDTVFTFQKVPVLHKGVTLQSEVRPPEIEMNEEAALKYLQNIYSTPSIWKKRNEPLRDAMGVLIYNEIRPPFDSTAAFLSGYSYDSIRVPWYRYYNIDSLKIILPRLEQNNNQNDSIQTGEKQREMYIGVKKNLRKVKLSPEMKPVTKNDTVSINDSVYVLMRDFIPSALPKVTPDTTILVISDTLPWATLPDKKFPFRRLRYPFMTDSIEYAVRTLLFALDDRDSSLVSFVENGRTMTDIWLNSNSDNLRRLWLHDMNGDSVTVWIGSPSKNTISLKPEDGVSFKRQTWRDDFADTKLKTISAKEEALRRVTLNKLNPNIWKYRGDVSFLFSQNSFSNWVSGGNNNISTTVDLNGYLYYTNNITKFSWTTSGRLAVGLIKTEGVDMKKSLDIIDVSSKLNHKAFGKFDFSGQLQFKTQSFPGYKYSGTDRTMISKFLNPATLIVGYGFDYSPKKTLSINVSPISYKGIFVPDTASIDQTLYGIDKDKRSKNEMGVYVTINSSDKLFDKITMTNKIQLFSNFLKDPQNVDVDWEMTMSTSLSWFADIKINTFLVYDDETLFPVYDKNKNPVLGPDGKQLAVPRIQFKELFGLTLLFRF